MNSDSLISEPSRDQAGSLRELLRVSVPLIISYTASATMYVVDRIYLSWYSVDALAASLPAGVLHWNLAALALGTVTYCNAFIGQYVGAGEPRRVGPVLWQGLYLSIVFAVLVVGCIPLGPYIFSAFGHDPTILDMEARYFNIMCCGTFGLLVGGTLACFYSGRGHTTTVMVVNILATLINVVLDYVLIFGVAGFPEMGIDGAVLATTISFAVIGLMYIAHMVWTQRRSGYCLWSGRRFDRELFARLCRFGFPSGLQQFLDVACWSIFVQLIGGLGNAELAATSLVFNLNSIVFVPTIGVGIAVTALVGQRIGEGRPQLAVRTTWLAFGLASFYTILFSAVYLFAPHLILKPYGISESQAMVEELVVYLLKFVAVYSVFDAMAIVFSSAIRGAGDTRFAMVLSVGIGIVFLVLPTYVASRFGSSGFTTAWYAVAVFLIVLGFSFMARFQQGRWKHMRVIEHVANEPAPEPEPAAV